jgi:hypothetical protein
MSEDSQKIKVRDKVIFQVRNNAMKYNSTETGEIVVFIPKGQNVWKITLGLGIKSTPSIRPVTKTVDRWLIRVGTHSYYARQEKDLEKI